MFRALLILLLLACNALAQDVRITEFLPVNTSGIKDEDGTFQPWIEIWNPKTTKVTLTGWKLVHGASQWTFPNSVEIPPDEYMIVFADSKNRTALAAPLHTNFTLSGTGGGPLQLLPADASPASTFTTYPALAANVSYGRDGAEIGQIGSYTNPTPGEANNYSGNGVAGKVTISIASQAFTGTLSVNLQQVTPVAGAVIRYTVNGALPISTSAVFNGTPLNVSTTTMLRARVFEPGKLPGETETAGYLLLDGSTANFNTAAPIVVVSNFGLGTFPDTGDQSAFMWVWQPGGDGRARLNVLPTLATRCVVDRRGSSTLVNAKTNFNLEARKKRDNEDQDVPLLGMPDGSDWVFHAPYDFDRALLRNPFVYALSNNIGRQAMRTRMAEVFVETTGGALAFTTGESGDYYGLYNVMEKIRRDPERVNIHSINTYDNGAVTRTGGYIVKVDRTDPDDQGFDTPRENGSNMTNGFAFYYPKEIEIEAPQRAPQYSYITNHFITFDNLCFSPGYTNPATGYASMLDVPAAIDHHLLQVWPLNVDGMRLSSYIQKERGGKIVYGPVWDYDRTMESTDGRDNEPRTWRSEVSDLGTDFFNYTWWARLFADPDFYQKYIDRWVELRRGPFSASAVNALLDTLNAQLTTEGVNRDLARWKQSKRTGTFPGSPTANYGGTQAGEVLRIKEWLQVRANFMDGQWVAPVTFSAAGGNITPGLSLTMTAEVGATIYYTLDGTDPRPSGGGVPSGANVKNYSIDGPPPAIDVTTRVKARAYWPTKPGVLTGANNPPLRSAWSGLTNARYSIDTPASAANLLVTEINFHPTDPTAAELSINPVFEDSSFEFVELKNIGATPIDLNGVRFSLGITFTFTNEIAFTLQPGQFVIVAANPAALTARYGALANVVGPFDNNLDNGGELLVVRSASNAIIADFTFNDSWYGPTDGGGKTLAIYNPTAPPGAFSTAANWRASHALGGSPGANEPNFAPVVNAGSDRTGTLPSIAIAATTNDDLQPTTPLTLAWSKISGPGTVGFAPVEASSTTASFSLPGVYTLRLSASDSALSASDDLAVTMRDHPGEWLLRNPGLGTLNDDPDSDGRPNWFEWALLLNPSSGAGGDGTLLGSENGHLTLTYSRQKNSPFVSYTVQVTGDVGAWADPLPGDVGEVILADDGITQTVKATDNSSGTVRRFIRLKVTPLQ